jgi:hypothetical protein
MRVYAVLTPRSRRGPRLATPSMSSSAARTPERFIENMRRDEPELAPHLRIKERELEAGGQN